MTPRKSPQKARRATNGRKTGQGKGAPAKGRSGQKAKPSPVTWATAHCEATSTGWHVVLPTPERTNAIWRQWRGRTLVSAKHRQDKATIPTRFGKIEPFRGDVAVRLVWVRERKAGDVDGRIKATLDLLTAMGLWLDDAQVAELTVLRVDDPTKAAGMYVWAWPFDEPKVEAA